MAKGLAAHDIDSLVPADRLDEMQAALPDLVVEALPGPGELDIDLLIVFGGDGTILTAAEWALPTRTPLLGVNMGHVGFLAELEAAETTDLVERVVEKRYQVEERVTIAIDVEDEKGESWHSFAINEMSMEKAGRSKMIDVLVSVDQRPLSRWACDGVLVSTPTGSTAYAFSAGGPVIWPDVEAIELVPLLAHALFAKPLVLSPDSVIELALIDGAVTIWCDGRRQVAISAGSITKVTRHATNLRLARLMEQPFTTRLVKKFQLPVDGWRR